MEVTVIRSPKRRKTAQARLVDGVLEYLESKGFPKAVEERLIEESLTFALPPELRKDLPKNAARH